MYREPAPRPEQARPQLLPIILLRSWQQRVVRRQSLDRERVECIDRPGASAEYAVVDHQRNTKAECQRPPGGILEKLVADAPAKPDRDHGAASGSRSMMLDLRSCAIV